MKTNKILNVPIEDYVYEFSVVVPTNDGNFVWHSNHAYIEDALDEIDKTPGSVLSHDLRVSHKMLRKEYEKLMSELD